MAKMFGNVKCGTMKSAGLVILVTCGLLISAQSSAEVFKWVDEKGAIHYGDRKPDGVESKTLKLKSAPPAAAAASETNQNIADTLAKEREKAAETEYQGKYDQEQKNLDKERCRIAKENLATIDNKARIKIEENGQQRYLTPEEIAEKRAEMQKIVDTECAGQ